MKNYADTLREYNLKATPQRLEISSALDRYGHVNIDNLYEMMLKKFNSISLATIYKNINLMVTNRYIQEVKIPNAKSVYELTKEAHAHMVCLKCSNIEDISIDTTNIASQLSNTTDFKTQKIDIVISGICKNCQ